MKRASECVSDLALDRLRAQELVDSSVEARHVASCDACSERLAALKSASEALSTSVPNFSKLRARHEERQRKTNSRGWRGVLAVGVPSLAAVCGLILWWNARPQVDNEAAMLGTRTKGAASIEFFVKRDGKVSPGQPDMELHPGDSIRFSYTSSEPSELAIVSWDGHQAFSVYYSGGDRSAHVAAGTDVLLEESVVLDDVLGPERVLGVFCSTPFEVSSLRDWKDKSTSPKPECHVTRLSWKKVSR